MNISPETPRNMKRRQVQLVDLTAQYRTIAGEVTRAITKVIADGDFILGHELELFEEEFADFCGVRYSVGVDSGTSALELALVAYEIGAGSEVIAPANTFIATALAISHVGATPVLVDVDPRTYTIDAAAVRRALTSRTKAIIPVHLNGHPARMDAIQEIAEEHSLIVIEDACQAHGSSYHGKRAGSMGHAAAFSFYPGKNLGAYGDGGMITTNDLAIAKRVKMLRNYGQSEKYHHLLQGYNRRLDTLQAAVLRVKLRHLESWNAARRWNAQVYNKLLADSGVALPCEAPDAVSAWHLYVIRVVHRDALRDHLARQGISTGVHYPVPVHLQPACENLGYKPGDFPVTEASAQRILSLPMYAELTQQQLEWVAETIRAFTMAMGRGHLSDIANVSQAGSER
jgi:dTDP-4-amino-4,6-dideoxygalactose transaminase